MTSPSDKAKELIEKFYELNGAFVSSNPNKVREAQYHAKQCALICVDETLKELYDLEPTFDNSETGNFKHLVEHHINYWQSVKKQLEES